VGVDPQELSGALKSSFFGCRVVSGVLGYANECTGRISTFSEDTVDAIESDSDIDQLEIFGVEITRGVGAIH
jgi:hypothetical protein